MSLRISLFGHPSVRNSNGDRLAVSRPAMTLLAYLVLERRPVDRVDVAEFFYPNLDARRGRANISNLLWKLREALGDGYFERTYQTIALSTEEEVWADVQVFEDSLRGVSAESREKTGEEFLTAAVAPALALYRGPLMQNIFLTESPAQEEWHRLEQERFRRLFLEWSRRTAQFHLGVGEHQAAATLIAQALQHEPLDEPMQMLRLQLASARGEHSQIPDMIKDYRRRLIAELEVVPTEAFDQLAEQVTQASRQPSHAKAPAKPQMQHYAAPATLVRVVGREEQIRRIVYRLLSPGERLLTLAGLGGSGKTTMALAVADRAAHAFRDGVCFVPLASVEAGPSPQATRSRVIRAIAVALHLEGNEANIEDTLQSFLRSRELLIILDSYEHLVPSASLLSELLSVAPMTRLLVTSRERLNLLAEGVEFIDGLPLPGVEAELAQLEQNPAVELFATRARQVLPGFELTPDNAAAIRRICNGVEGLPLGIELAAHWVTLFSPAQIADAVERQLSFLVTPYSDVPERHRSIRGLFEHSWGLLSQVERRTLAAVSIFQYTFDRKAIEAVADCEISTILGLVNRFLIKVGGPGSYSLHPLVKSFAAERRVEADAVDERFFVHVLERLQPDATEDAAASDGNSAHDLVALQPADVAHAWELAVEQSRHDILAGALPHFARYWRLLGRQCEGILLLQQWLRVLDAVPTPSPIHQRWLGQLHHQIALAHESIGEHPKALHHGELALSYLQQAEDESDMARLLADLGGIYLNSDQADQAIIALEQAMVLGERGNNMDLRLDVKRLLTAIYWARGDWTRADVLYQQLCATAFSPQWPNLKDPKLYFEIFNQAAFRQDWGQAERALERLNACSTEQSLMPETVMQKRLLAVILLMGKQQWREAYQRALEIVDEATRSKRPDFRVRALDVAARAALHADSPATALSLSNMAVSAARDAGISIDLIDIRLAQATFLFHKGDIDQATDHLLEVAEYALARPNELFSIRRLIATNFYLAQIYHHRLPSALFDQAIACAATRPQTGFLTRAAAQRIAAETGLPLKEWEALAQYPVDWCKLQELHARIVQAAQGDQANRSCATTTAASTAAATGGDSPAPVDRSPASTPTSHSAAGARSSA